MLPILLGLSYLLPGMSAIGSHLRTPSMCLLMAFGAQVNKISQDVNVLIPPSRPVLLVVALYPTGEAMLALLPRTLT
jgi:hypothetical protein